eukprot:g4454.t1
MIHEDGSDLTINISLSRPGKDYDRGGLFFTILHEEEKKKKKCTNKATDNGKTVVAWKRYMIKHDRGNAILMDSHLLHGAAPIGSGRRLSLVLWCKTNYRFDNWTALPNYLQFRVLSFCTLQTICRCDTAGAGVSDAVWRLFFYRTVGLKRKAKGRTRFERTLDAGHRRDLPELASPPRLAGVVSEDSPVGEAYKEERLPDGIATWRQHFFETVSTLGEKKEERERRERLMESRCVKTCVVEPLRAIAPVIHGFENDDDDDDGLTLLDDVPANEPESLLRSKRATPKRQRNQYTPQRAAAICRRVLAFEGDIPLCRLFRGTRANNLAPLSSKRADGNGDQDLEFDPRYVHIRSPYASFVKVEKPKMMGRKKYFGRIIARRPRPVIVPRPGLKPVMKRRNVYYRKDYRLPVRWLVDTSAPVATVKDSAEADDGAKNDDDEMKGFMRVESSAKYKLPSFFDSLGNVKGRASDESYGME